MDRILKTFLVCTIFQTILAAPLWEHLRADENPPRAASQNTSFSLSFSKDLKQGPYEHLRISLHKTGEGKFAAKPREGDWFLTEFQASPASMRFLLATLDFIRFLDSTEDYESHLKVADRGLKTIVLEQNGKSRTAQFNYTTNKSMAAIEDYFEGAATTLLRVASLENAMKYDKLGLPEQLAALQTELNNRWLSETELLLPVLKKISNNSSFFKIVQRKAHQLVLQIETMKPAP